VHDRNPKNRDSARVVAVWRRLLRQQRVGDQTHSPNPFYSQRVKQDGGTAEAAGRSGEVACKIKRPYSRVHTVARALAHHAPPLQPLRTVCEGQERAVSLDIAPAECEQARTAGWCSATSSIPALVSRWMSCVCKVSEL